MYFGILPLNIFPDNTVHVIVLHDLSRFHHSHETHDFVRYIHQEQISCESIHVGILGAAIHHHPPHPQPPHQPDGADFVVTIKSLVIPQIIKVDVVVDPYAAEDISLVFTVSQL